MRFVALRHTTAIAAVATGLAFTAPAQAQDAANEDAAVAEGEGEIIVTATRREERLVDVPIAVSAFSAKSRGSSRVTYFTAPPMVLRP